MAIRCIRWPFPRMHFITSSRLRDVHVQIHDDGSSKRRSVAPRHVDTRICGNRAVSLIFRMAIVPNLVIT